MNLFKLVAIYSSFQYLLQERDLRRWSFDYIFYILGTRLIMHILYENWQVRYNLEHSTLMLHRKFLLIYLVQVFYTFVS